MASLAVAGRADLTDAQWARLEPLLPRGKKAGRPPKWSRRQLIDGIRWRTRAGTPWRDVPVEYGPWQTIYGMFRRWQRAGNWVFILKLLQALADASGTICWQVSVDSTIARTRTWADPALGGVPRVAAADSTVWPAGRTPRNRGHGIASKTTLLHK